MKQKVFAAGDPVPSIVEAVAEIEAGRWLILRGVPKHPKVLANMTLATLRAFVQSESLCYALEFQPVAPDGMGSIDVAREEGVYW